MNGSGTRAASPARAQRSRRKLGRDWTPIVYGGIFALIAAGLVAFWILQQSQTPGKVLTPTTATIGEQVPIEPGTHIQPPQRATYASLPPTSGKHYSITGVAPTSWGFNSNAVQPEIWVHNLEHGGVGVLYACDSDCAAEQANVQKFIQGAAAEPQWHEVKLIGTSYPLVGHKYALVAWGWRLLLDSWDPVVAAQFYAAHVDKGPEALP